MPVYNVEKYLRDALDSIAKQSFNNYELITVNDGSTDSSLEILKEYKRSSNITNLRIIEQENKGLSSARNVGIKLAKGRYVYFFDSDDIMGEDMLYKVYNFCDLNNLDIVRFNAKSFTNDGYKGWMDIYESSRLIDNKVYSNKDYFLAILKDYTPDEPVWLYVYKRELLQKNKLSFYEGILHEDIEFTPRVLYYANRIGYLKHYYFYRRYRDNSIMTSQVGNKKSIDGRIRVLYSLNNFYTKEKKHMNKFYRQYLINKILETSYFLAIRYKSELPILERSDFDLNKKSLVKYQINRNYRKTIAVIKGEVPLIKSIKVLLNKLR